MKKIIFLLVLIFAVSPVSFAKETSTDTIVISGGAGATLNHAAIKIGDADYRMWNGGNGNAYVEGDGTADGDTVAMYSVSLSPYAEKTISSFVFKFYVKQSVGNQTFYFHEIKDDIAVNTMITYSTGIEWESDYFASAQSSNAGGSVWVLHEVDFTEKIREAIAAGKENFAVAVTAAAGEKGAYAKGNHETYTVSAVIVSTDNHNPYIETVSNDFSAAKNKTVQVSFRAGDEDGDPVTVYFFVNGRETDAVTENIDGVYTASFTFYKKGSYTISAYAADEYGGKSQTAEVTADVFDYRVTQYFTDAEGKELSADSTSVKNNITIEKICEYSEPLILLIAVYDSDNKMTASNIKNVETESGENYFDISVDIPEMTGAYTVKGFVWNNLSDGFSVSDTYEFIGQQDGEKFE